MLGIALSLIITYDMGGSVNAADRYWSEIARQERHVVIDGPCASACTIVLFHVKPENICATSRGRFGFHYATYQGQIDRKYTRYLISRYPASVRNWLRGKRLPTRGMLWAKATRFVRHCDEEGT